MKNALSTIWNNHKKCNTLAKCLGVTQITLLVLVLGMGSMDAPFGVKVATTIVFISTAVAFQVAINRRDTLQMHDLEKCWRSISTNYTNEENTP